MPANAFVSAARVFWMSASGGVVEVAAFWAGGWPLLSSCWMMVWERKFWMMVWERKFWMSGFTLASLSGGLREIMMFRRVSNDFSTVGMLDMMVV